jgi:ABC-type transport system involved in Fe-S cluster assembly fused permease/ATPase subunit
MMKDGHICCRGTHDELMEREKDYVALVNTHISKTGDQAQ